jgi:RNA polymerase sigma-70 factor, ECF subfamily
MLISRNIKEAGKRRLLEENKALSEVRQGSKEAFAAIIEQYQMAIQRYLYRFTGDYEAAQDLAQETFLKAYKDILKDKQIINLKAWLYRIATNTALENRRRQKLFSNYVFNQIRRVRTSYNWEHSCENIAVNEALLAVPYEQRTCMELCFIEGFKYKEIGEILGISEEAVRKRIARGRQTFIEAYGRKNDDKL